MPIFIPVIVLGAGAVSAAGGLGSVVSGQRKMAKAKRIAEDARTAYDDELAETKDHAKVTDDAIHAYGDLQRQAMTDVVERMVAFLLANNQAVSQSLSKLLNGSEVTLAELQQLAGNAPVADIMRGAVRAAGLGAAVYTGVPSLVTAMASASTGTAISSLSGAAATNAVLAWLGGGSLAAGGGGMALGATVLNAAVAGPVLLIGGLVFNGQGEKAHTKAVEYRTLVNIEIAEQRVFRATLTAIQNRVAELSAVLTELSHAGVAALEALEAVDFDPDLHSELFANAILRATAVKAIVDTPLLTVDGNLHESTARLLFTYRQGDT